MCYKFIQIKTLKSIPDLSVVRLILNAKLHLKRQKTWQCCKSLEKLTNSRMKNAGEYWAQD